MYVLGPGGDPGVVGHEACTIFGSLFKKKNTKLGTKANVYLELEKKSQQITYLKKPDKYHKHKKSRK